MIKNFDKKVIFFDIDGTLIASNREILPSTMKIIEKLALTGEYDFYISTGRSYHTLRELEPIRKYIKGYNIANGGEIVIDDNMVMFDYMIKNSSDILIEDLMKQKISFGILSTKQDYMYFYDNIALDNFEKSVNQKIVNYAGSSWYPKGQIVQIWVFAPESILDKIKAKHNNFTYFYWKHYGSDIVPLNRNKGTGIKSIIQYMGYDYNKTYAFGDSSNDIDMFKEVKTSFAMGQSQDFVLKAATYITDDYNHDGIANAIIKYIKK